MPFPESCEFEVPALIWMFVVNVCPPSVLNAPQNWASSFGTPSLSPGPPVPRSSPRVVPHHGEVPSSRIERDLRQELAVLRLVIVHPHWTAPRGTLIIGEADVDVHVVALVGLLECVHQIHAPVVGSTRPVPGKPRFRIYRTVRLCWDDV